MKRFCIFLLAAASSGQACNPRFSETILDIGFAILRAPESTFYFEISQMKLGLELPGGLVLSEKPQPQRFPRNGKLPDEIKRLLKLKPEALANFEGKFWKGAETSIYDLTRDIRDVGMLSTNAEQLAVYRNCGRSCFTAKRS